MAGNQGEEEGEEGEKEESDHSNYAIHHINEEEELMEENKEKEGMGEREDKRGHICVVCMSPPTHPSVSPCGHIHCWGCLIKWVTSSSSPMCPTCRRPCPPQKIIRLMNY